MSGKWIAVEQEWFWIVICGDSLLPGYFLFTQSGIQVVWLKYVPTHVSYGRNLHSLKGFSVCTDSILQNIPVSWDEKMNLLDRRGIHAVTENPCFTVTEIQKATSALRVSAFLEINTWWIWRQTSKQACIFKAITQRWHFSWGLNVLRQDCINQYELYEDKM